MAHEKVLHILPSDERNMFTESLAIRLNQPVTMSILLVGHPSEQFRLGREVRAKRFGKVAIDVGVLFLGCDGEGEDLSFIQFPETHVAKIPSQRIERTTPPSTRNAAPFVAEE